MLYFDYETTRAFEKLVNELYENRKNRKNARKNLKPVAIRYYK